MKIKNSDIKIISASCLLTSISGCDNKSFAISFFLLIIAKDNALSFTKKLCSNYIKQKNHVWIEWKITFYKHNKKTKNLECHEKDFDLKTSKTNIEFKM